MIVLCASERIVSSILLICFPFFCFNSAGNRDIIGTINGLKAIFGCSAGTSHLLRLAWRLVAPGVSLYPNQVKSQNQFIHTTLIRA